MRAMRMHVLPALALALCVPAQDARPERPNIVLFLVDDLGWRDLGCYGSSFHETPGIDRLAEAGMRFTSAYAAAPVCSPSRAAILTGKAPARLHLTDWLPGRRYPYAKLAIPDIVQELGFEERTLAEVLAEAGYACWHVGKWHLGEEPPTKHGFHVNVAGHSKGQPGSYHDPYEGGAWTVRNLPAGGKEGDYLTDRLTDEALALIEARGEKPFFLFMSYYTVHAPYQGKKELVAKYRAKKKERAEFARRHAVYASMVQSLDESVGRILDKLAALGIAESTAVILTSDNGGVHRVTDNAPLRAGKGFLYEGGIREPLIVRWPGQVQAGSSCKVPVIGMDLYPTILRMAGIESSGPGEIDGFDLVPVLEEPSAGLGREELYWHYPHYHTPKRPPCSTVRSGDFKLIEFLEDGRLELYDLGRDIGETKNLAEMLPEKTSELRRMLGAWRASVGAQMPRPNPDHDPAREFEGGRRASKKN